MLLVFAVFRKATGQELLSGFVAALFAIHPVHAESVAWVSERKDVLSMFFGLLTLWAFVNYAQRGRLSSFVFALAFYTLSLMSKQTLVTLPFVLLLLDAWPLKRFNRRAILEKIPFLVVSAVFCVVAVLAQASGLSVRSLEAAPLAIRVANAAIAYVSYLQKAIVPWNLGVYYPFSTDLSLPLVAFSLALLVALTVLAFDFRRRYPYLAVGWFWFLGTLVPMIGLVQVGLQQMADRYAYFPFLGLYLALGGFVTSVRQSALSAFTASSGLSKPVTGTTRLLCSTTRPVSLAIARLCIL